ncbi:MAG: hypothetical protein KJN71_01760, partial [Acidimicrobiia bacterium]|nr:hypothetical protein [Acidimicrobiia bacterium]
MSDRVERYAKAMAAQDFDALEGMRHADYECYYPQSGERFHGHENWSLAHRDYGDRFDLPVPIAET